MAPRDWAIDAIAQMDAEQLLAGRTKETAQ